MTDHQIVPLIKTSKVAIFMQLLMIPVTIVIVAIIGVPLDSVLEIYIDMEENPLTGLLRDDLYNILMVSLYIFSFPGLFFILRRHRFSLSFVAMILIFSGVIFALSSHSGFSLLHLSKQYWSATDEISRVNLLAAGETVISQNMWNSSSGYFAGIFLQGGGILISIAMIGSTDFSKLTIISGVAANGLDLIQHLMHPFLPEVSQLFMYVMGPFYLIWFFMLFKDLKHYIKIYNKENEVG